MYERREELMDPGLEQAEQIREGSKHSEYRCKAALGLRCVDASVEKLANV